MRTDEARVDHPRIKISLSVAAITHSIIPIGPSTALPELYLDFYSSVLAGLPFGLFMTVVGGGELFTGNTAVVTAAAIEGKASTGGLLKNWFFSYVGNFLGYVLQISCPCRAPASRSVTRQNG